MLPELSEFELGVIEYLQRIGLTNGDNAWDYINIKAWVELSRLTPNPWQIDQIRSLSLAYLNARIEYSSADKKTAEPPYVCDEYIAWRRDMTESAMRAMLASASS